MLTTNRNLLIVADVLVVHRGLAEQNPQIVAGLVHGLLEGNRMVRDRQADYLDVVGRAFKWSRDDTKAELASVHLSNLPENLAFFSGEIDEAGSFGGIYQSAVYAYGSDSHQGSGRFRSVHGSQARSRRSTRAGTYKDQKIAIAPIRTASTGTLEVDPLLSKDIRFLFEPNSATLDMANQENIRNLEAIRKLVQVSPGSTLLLRGHVDNALVARFRQQGGEAYVRTQALRAVELSKERAAEIRKQLNERTRSPTHASTSSAAAGRSPCRRTPSRTGASKCSGSRWNNPCLNSTDTSRGASRRSATNRISRREMLKTSLAAAAGVLLSDRLQLSAQAAGASSSSARASAASPPPSSCRGPATTSRSSKPAAASAAAS